MQKPAITEEDVAPGSILTCSRCSYKWALRKKNALPKNCPKCRSTLWMKNYHVYECMKCSHKWGTANENPLRCPKCHTSKWNSPPVPRMIRTESLKSRLKPEIREEVYDLYEDGKGCIEISNILHLSFGDVMDAIVIKYSGESVRI